MSRHAEPRGEAELAEIAAAMPPIPEHRDQTAAWDEKPWMDRADVIDPVGDEEAPFTWVVVHWADPDNWVRRTAVGERGGRQADLHSDASTEEAAQADGERFLRAVAGG